MHEQEAKREKRKGRVAPAKHATIGLPAKYLLLACFALLCFALRRCCLPGCRYATRRGGAVVAVFLFSVGNTYLGR